MNYRTVSGFHRSRFITTALPPLLWIPASRLQPAYDACLAELKHTWHERQRISFESIQVLQLLIECDLFQRKSRIRHCKSSDTYLLSTSRLMFCLLYNMETFGSSLSATSWSTSEIAVMQRWLLPMDCQKSAWWPNLTFKQHPPDWSQWNLQRWQRSAQAKSLWLTG